MRRRHVIAALVIAAIVALLVLSPSLPSPSDAIQSLIEKIATSLGRWAYLLVAFMATAETAAFLGFIAPGEFAVLLGGVLAGEGTLSIQLLIGIVWASVVTGDAIGFFLGRKLGRAFVRNHGHRVRFPEHRLDQVEDFFRSHGGKTIFLGRWIGFVRPLMPFTAGTSGMSFRRFLPYDVLGAGTWSAAICLLGYVFWRNFGELTSIVGRSALVLGVTVAAVIGAVQALKRLRRPEDRKCFLAWLERASERPALRPLAAALRGLWRVFPRPLWLYVLRPLWRYVLRPAWVVVGPPTRFFGARLTPGELGIELTTLLAIAAVCAYVFGLQANLLETRTLITGDSEALEVARHVQAGVLTALAKGLSALGVFAVVLIVLSVGGGFLLGRRRYVEGAIAAAGFVSTEIAVQIAKHAIDRPRPANPIVVAGGWSFPSGHAAIAVGYLAMAVILARGAERAAIRIVLVGAGTALAVLIGLSRVYLRVHYLSDVIGGWMLGLTVFSVLGAIGLVVDYLIRRGSQQAQPAGRSTSEAGSG